MRGDGYFFMGFLLFLSDLMVPLIIFYIVGFGILGKRPVFDDFLHGAKEGMGTVVQVVPSLVGLMTAVGVLRASGFLEFLSQILEAPATSLGLPGQIIPIAFVRMISNSAAVGLLLDLFKNYGPDSRIGLMASILMGSTETVLYCMSVYLVLWVSAVPGTRLQGGFGCACQSGSGGISG